jgi:hypothetical protein
VVEIVENVQYLYNACSTRIKVTANTAQNTLDVDYLEASTTLTELDPLHASGGVKSVVKLGIAHRALRLNANINATVIPDYIPLTDETTQNHACIRQAANKAAAISGVFCDLSTRDHAYDYRSNDVSHEKYYYPLYKAKTWTQGGTELTAKLDHGVKQVAAVKLLGYSLVNKRAVGIHHAHEMQGDDYLILRVKEIDGHVISNNKYANGAFAVLRAGDSSHQGQGATEFSAYEPGGIVCVAVDKTNATLRNLTIQVTDRLGRPAHFGRFHLWFKLLVTHG